MAQAKVAACNAGEWSSIPRMGRSLRRGYDNPLQCFLLENSKDRGAWQATVHGIERVGADQKTNTHTFFF